MLNSGQAVVCAQRFIITEKVYDEFRHKLLQKIKTETVIGDPMDPKTNLGPLGAKGKDIDLKNHVKYAMKYDKAELIYGNLDFEMEGELKNGFWVEPMVLEGIKFDTPAYHQDNFGPVFSLYKVKD